MKKFLAFLVLLTSSIGYAQLIVFEPNHAVKNEEFNQNFDYIRQLFLSKNANINFLQYNNQQLIDRDSLENNFDIVRGFGLNVTQLGSQTIKSNEINQAFNDMVAGAVIFDDIPLSNDGIFNATEDTNLSSSVSFQNSIGTISAQLVSPTSSGILILNNNGSFSYTPNLNFNGSDSFLFTVSDGSNVSNTATVSIVVAPVDDAPVANSLVATSFNEDTSSTIILSYSDIDGDHASSCNITFFNNSFSSGACTCSLGICSTTIQGQPNYSGSGFIKYTL